MDWFLYDNDLSHEKLSGNVNIQIQKSSAFE